MANGNGSESAGRLDRIEGLLEVLVNEHIQFADEHKRLLTAQVVLTDRIGSALSKPRTIGAGAIAHR